MKKNNWLQACAITMSLTALGWLLLYALNLLSTISQLPRADQLSESHRWIALQGLIFANLRVVLAYLLIGTALGALIELLARLLAIRTGSGRVALGTTLHLGGGVVLTLRAFVDRPGIIEDFIERGAIPAVDRAFLVRVVQSLPLEWVDRATLVLILALAAAILIRQWPIRRPSLMRLGIGSAIILAITVANQLLSLRQPKSGPSDTPNILIIGIDSLRPDHLSFTGYPRNTTPHLDRLLTKSVFFDRAYAAVARTAPSWTSILTGAYPVIHGIRHMFPEERDRAVFVPTLTQLLKSKGYETAITSDYAGEMFNLIDLGFDHQEVPEAFSLRSVVGREVVLLHFLPYLFLGERYGSWLLDEYGFMPNHADPFRLTDRIDRRIQKLERSGRPYFMIGFYSSLHLPYTLRAPYYRTYSDPEYWGPSKFAYSVNEILQIETAYGQEQSAREKRQLIDLYDQALLETDTAIGDLLSRLEARGSLKNTIIVVLSDHGEVLAEDDRPAGHGGRLGEGDWDTRLTLAIVQAGIKPQRVSQVVRTIDLAPTLLAAAGLSPPPTMTGVNLLARSRSDGTLEIPPLEAFMETDISLNSKQELGGKNAITYPGISELLEPELRYPGLFVLKPQYRFGILRAKWRMLVSDAGKVLYYPTPQSAQFEYYPSWSGNTPDQKTQRLLRESLQREMLKEPGTRLDHGFRVEYR